MTNILITGSQGQIGTELVPLLRIKYGRERVIASDIKETRTHGPFERLDVLDKTQFERIIEDYQVDTLIHNASILSAAGEKKPDLAIQVNVKGIEIALNLAKKYDLRIFAPSSIAAFGPSTPKINTPDATIMRPTTIYGVSKVYLELLGEYYHSRWGVDFRSLRYPGIISSEAPPGGGTTDYAVTIFHEALRTGNFECFLEPFEILPMMYMPDCLKSTLMMLEVDEERLSQRVYNVGAIEFNPEELANEIKKHLPEFTISYQPDFRQKIAEGWPKSLSDTAARNDWDWSHDFDLQQMVKDMLEKLSTKFNIPFVSAV